MENRQGYDPSEFEDDDYMNPQPAADKSIRGYRIVIIILSAILVALSVLYYSIHRQQMIDNELLQADRDSIQNDLGRLMTDYDNLQISNDSISANLTLERERADSLMTRLKKERSWNLAKIKQYEKEVGTLRTIMRGYVRQIDSLNTLNKKLIKENGGFRKEISSANLRAEMAEEKAAELDNKVRIGAVLRARDISLAALNNNSRDVSRIKNASRLRVEFTLAGNDLARQQGALRAHHLARRLCADHRGDADLRIRGRKAELFGHARGRIRQHEGPRRGYLLHQHGIHRRNLQDPDLLRRPPDRPDRRGDAIARSEKSGTDLGAGKDGTGRKERQERTDTKEREGPDGKDGTTTRTEKPGQRLSPPDCKYRIHEKNPGP